jgi:YidC/Oxa1 family membrane protein insertase
MDKKTLLAIALSLVIWIGWQKIYMEPFQQKAALEAKQQAELIEASKLREAQKAQIDSKGVFPESERKKVLKAPVVAAKKVPLSTNSSKLELSSGENFIGNWELSDFSATLSDSASRIHMKEVTGFESQLRLRVSDAVLSDDLSRPWSGIEKAASGAVVSEINTEKLRASRSFTMDSTGFGAQLDWRLQFQGEVPKFVFVDIFGSPKRENDTEGSIFGQAPDKVHLSYRDLSGRNSISADTLKEAQEVATGIKWLGLDTRYFLLALAPLGDWKLDAGAQLAPEYLNGIASARGSLVFPTNGKKDISFSAKVYFGPKNIEELKAAEPVLVDAIDFGWTSFLAIPLLHGLKWLYIYLNNYGLAIILLTFFIKMLLFPLTYKSMVSMAKMAKLQPQLNALREKYKDDKEKLNMEMMSFMKTNGYNPVGGCLPILLQMPIFFALYRVLFNSMELYQAPFYGWINDLSSPDPWFVTPVLLTGLMYFQQKLSPNTAADPTQQKMLQFMPVMFGVFMLLLPAGLNIYMVVNSGVSILQQYFLNRKLGITKSAKA